MDIAVRHSPSFAAARVTLAPNEQIRAESGAMMATSSGVGVASTTRNPSALEAWIRQLMPGETGGAGGVLGGILGR